MIDTKLEEFTAAEAVDAGLIEAVKRGETKVSGTYALTVKGEVEFDQNNFLFKDKNNNLRAGVFESADEICAFWDKYCESFKK